MENRFVLKKHCQRIYVTRNEDTPDWMSKRKHFIPKVMSFSVVARTSYGHHPKYLFNGKVGLRPLVEMVPAQRPFINCLALTLEMKHVKVNRDIYPLYLTENGFLIITSKFPTAHCFHVVKQGNAKQNMSINDAVRTEQGPKGNLIFLASQWPHSPDYDVLDLGFQMQFKMQMQTMIWDMEIYLSSSSQFINPSVLYQMKL